MWGRPEDARVAPGARAQAFSDVPRQDMKVKGHLIQKDRKAVWWWCWGTQLLLSGTVVPKRGTASEVRPMGEMWDH